MENHIIKQLNEAGYLNEGTNRERVIRNLNLLIDAGVVSFNFITAEKYNRQEDGRSFWFVAENGKKRCTAYKVTIFGKTFYGSFIPKCKTTTQLIAVCKDGTKEYDSHTECYDNSRLDLFEIMTRVARLISVLRERGDFMKAEAFAAKGECSCSKCDGVGVIPAFAHYANGVCFDCGGMGINRSKLKAFIQESVDVAI